MKKYLVSSICFVFIITFATASFSNKIFDEAKFAPSKADIYVYVNLKSFRDFAKNKKISKDDILTLLVSEMGMSIKEKAIFSKLYDSLQEFLVIGETNKIEKKSGLLVYFNLKKKFPEIAVVLKQFKKVSLYGNVSAYEIDKRKKVYLIEKNNLFIVGFKGYIEEYLKSKKNNRPAISSGIKTAQYGSRGRSIYIYTPVSKYIKDKLDKAVAKGAKIGSGLSANVFIQALLKIKSFSTAVVLKKNIHISSAVIATNRVSRERILMMSHFAIVGSSFAVSFADMFLGSVFRKSSRRNKRFDKKKDLEKRKRMERIQKAIGRIKTSLTKRGVVISFSFNDKETTSLVKTLKKIIAKGLVKAKRKEMEKQVQQLIYAIKYKNFERVKSIAEKIKDVNSKTRWGRLPLYVAAQSGDVKIIQYLISKGADVNLKNGRSLTPIFGAVIENKIEAVKILIRNEANLNIIDNKGTTPLLRAIKMSYDDIIKELLKSGADVKIKNRYGESPLYAVIGMVKDNSIITSIIKSGADVNQKNNEGNTPLHRAASLGQIKVVNILLSAGADKSARNYNGKRAADKAKLNGYSEIYNLLGK